MTEVETLVVQLCREDTIRVITLPCQFRFEGKTLQLMSISLELAYIQDCVVSLCLTKCVKTALLPSAN